MAFYQNDEEENKNVQGMNSQKPEDTQNGAAPQLSGAISGASSGPVPTGSQSTPKATSSGMTGFQSYQKANQGTATNKLGSAANSSVANQGQAAKTGIDQATASFGAKVDAGSLANRENAVSDVKNVVNSARAVTAPPAPAAAPAAPTTDASGAPVAAPSTLVDPTQASRFQEVINAKYQGPESLRQSGDYGTASGKVAQAQTAIDQTKDANGRESLLRNLFSQGGNYTQGLNKLDSGLLNASKEGISQLQQTAKAQGNIGQQLDQAQIASANLAQNRTGEIQKIQDDSRDIFNTGLKQERDNTEDRLSKVYANWNTLPDYYKDIIRNSKATNAASLASETAKLTAPDMTAAQKALQDAAVQKSVGNLGYQMGGTLNEQELAANQANYDKTYDEAKANYDRLNGQNQAYQSQLQALQQKYNPNAVNFSAEEAAILGINNGEGLYNKGADVIKTGKYDATKLISKDEQARQTALSQLAGLDQLGKLDTNIGATNQYADASKAGTMTATDALDLAGTRAALNDQEQTFRTNANAANLTGEGTQKISRGNLAGKKTKNYNASVDANVGDLLKNSGYDTSSPVGQGQVNYNPQDVLNYAANNAQAKSEHQTDNSTLGGIAAGAGTGAAIGSVVPGVGTGIGAAAGASLGAALGSGTVDTVTQYQDILRSLGAGGVADGIQDGRNIAGKAYSDTAKYDPLLAGANLFSRALGVGDVTDNIGSLISGIDVKSMNKQGNAGAQQHAQADLQNKISDYLNTQGFSNRTQVVNDNATSARTAALQQLLANLDSTNRKG